MKTPSILAKLLELLKGRPKPPAAPAKFATPPVTAAGAPYTFTDPVTKHQRDDYWRSR